MTHLKQAIPLTQSMAHKLDFVSCLGLSTIFVAETAVMDISAAIAWNSLHADRKNIGFMGTAKGLY
jgi:hypothetical protein